MDRAQTEPRFAMLEMSGKPESTDDIGKSGTSEERSCGFAREAFYIKWGFFEFSERVRSPTMRKGNTRDDRLIPQHKRSLPILFNQECGCGPPSRSGF